jgi:hypothetical protein
MFKLRPASRDDYGVSELLEAVSKRSSLPESERQEISEIVGRVRTSVVHKPKPTVVHKPKPTVPSPVAQQDSSPSSSFRFWDLVKRQDSPTHDRNEWKEDFLKKEDLLRGFGSAPTGANPERTVASQSNGGLMRDFASPPAAVEVDNQSNCDEESTTESEGFEEDQNI